MCDVIFSTTVAITPVAIFAQVVFGLNWTAGGRHLRPSLPSQRSPPSWMQCSLARLTATMTCLAGLAGNILAVATFSAGLAQVMSGHLGAAGTAVSRPLVISARRRSLPEGRASDAGRRGTSGSTQPRHGPPGDRSSSGRGQPTRSRLRSAGGLIAPGCAGGRTTNPPSACILGSAAPRQRRRGPSAASGWGPWWPGSLGGPGSCWVPSGGTRLGGWPPRTSAARERKGGGTDGVVGI